MLSSLSSAPCEPHPPLTLQTLLESDAWEQIPRTLCLETPRACTGVCTSLSPVQQVTRLSEVHAEGTGGLARLGLSVFPSFTTMMLSFPGGSWVSAFLSSAHPLKSAAAGSARPQALEWPKHVPALAERSPLRPQSVQTVLWGDTEHSDGCHQGGGIQLLPWQPSICEHGPLLHRLEEA